MSDGTSASRKQAFLEGFFACLTGAGLFTTRIDALRAVAHPSAIDALGADWHKVGDDMRRVIARADEPVEKVG